MKTFRNFVRTQGPWLALGITAFTASAAAANAALLGTMGGQLLSPVRVAADAAGNLYVADPGAGEIAVFDFAGRRTSLSLPVASPVAIALDASGNFLVGDQVTGSISVFNAQWQFQYKLGIGDGEFGMPGHLAADPAPGSTAVYVCDGPANQVKVYTNGIALLAFGQPGVDPGQFNFPAGVWVSPAGEVFVVDQGNDRVQVFNRAGGYLRKFALGSGGMFGGPSGRSQGITGDSQGRLYVADTFQGFIRVFATNGTKLGTLGSYGEGVGQLRSPSGLVIDSLNRLAVASANNTRLELFGLDNFLQVTVSPSSRYIAAGTAVSLAATVGGSGPFTYQWRLGTNNLTDGNGVSGAATAMLTLDNVMPASSGDYSVVVVGPSATMISPDITLTVMVAPAIVSGPASQSVVLGESVEFTVSAMGDALIWQWQHNGFDIPGATGPTLWINSVLAEDAGLYSVTARNEVGIASSSAALLTVVIPPAPPLLDPLAPSPDGQLLVRFGADLGYTYAVQSSLNLTSWQSVTNVVSETGMVEVVLPVDPGTPAAFFRVLWTP